MAAVAAVHVGSGGAAAPLPCAPMNDRRDEYLAPRWKGQPGRLDVWYATATLDAAGTGLWLHHELVAPGAGRPYLHGWAALFPPAEPPVLERFGPERLGSDSVAAWSRVPGFRADAASVTPSALCGSAGGLAWDLSWRDDSPPLFTFPAWAWHRELLPAAQMVPAPTATVSGTVSLHDRVLTVERGRGALARIYGHGNAQRWVWLHADLGGDDALEVVAATPRVAPWLPPLPLVRLRHRGRDWPRDPLAAALFLRCRTGARSWEVRGAVGRRRIRVSVELPVDETVSLGYVDPDGATATCRNSERASADISVELRAPRSWHTEAHWTLDGTAHAEMGDRP